MYTSYKIMSKVLLLGPSLLILMGMYGVNSCISKIEDTARIQGRAEMKREILHLLENRPGIVDRDWVNFHTVKPGIEYSRERIDSYFR